MSKRKISKLRSRRSGAARKAGFTLVEMMLALVAGLICVTSVYAITQTSTRHFHEQQRIAQSQMSIRTAMAQLRSDIANAAFLGVPDSNNMKTCGATSAFRVRGIDLIDDDSTPVLTNIANNANVSADTLRLTGNYATGDRYQATGFFAGGTRVGIQDTWQGFRRSFGDPTSAAAFDAVFADGRYVHIETDRGFHFVRQITAQNGAGSPPDITVNPALPMGSGCVDGFGRGHVSPLVRIEYLLRDNGDADGTMSNLQSPGTLAGADGPVLVRREIAFTAGGTAVANTERIVAENVAELDFDVMMNTGITARTWIAGAAAQTALDANPQNVRAVRARLSIRTQAEDPRFGYLTRAAGDPLTSYDLRTVAGVFNSGARVRTLQSEITLSNFMPRTL